MKSASFFFCSSQKLGVCWSGAVRFAWYCRVLGSSSEALSGASVRLRGGSVVTTVDQGSRGLPMETLEIRRQPAGEAELPGGLCRGPRS